MTRKNTYELTVQVPKEIAEGIKSMAGLKDLSIESLLRLWIEEALEREELRFERLLLFADMTKELNPESVKILSKLKNHLDEASDGSRNLDTYLVKCRNMNIFYKPTSGTLPIAEVTE